MQTTLRVDVDTSALPGINTGISANADRDPTVQADGRDTPLPATVLVGFLGSGKTTLLRHLLQAEHEGGQRLAVIVNDMAELAIDDRLVRQTTERLVTMANGCICCTLRADLLAELRTLSALPDIDGIVIESTGVGEPLPIAQTFFMEDLPELVRLDSVITVVDAANFWDMFGRVDWIEDDAGEPVESALAPLLVDQLEFTNLVLLNKTDLAAAEDVERLEGFVRQLNPYAPVLRTAFSVVDPAEILNTGRFDYAEAPEAEGWETEWAKDGSEAEEYGFQSVVYTSDIPFAYAPFRALFDDWQGAIIRAKGFVVCSDHAPLLVSQAGSSVTLEGLEGLDLGDDEGEGKGGDEVRDGWESDVDADAEAGAVDDEELTRTELVFIGRGIDAAALRASLDACLAQPAAESHAADE